MDDALLAVVVDRLTEAGLDPDVEAVVLSACVGDQELADALGGDAVPRPSIGESAEGPEPVGAYLSKISVEGFRGIGPAQHLDFTAGPGLTLVVGRNGSGKSSFVEALELLLTGSTRRWADRPKVWKDAWRNLHNPEPTAVAAEFVVDGQAGSTHVASKWATGAELDDAETWAQHAGEKRGERASLGWDDALDAFRPFLTHNELGSLLEEGPSKLYDALFSILGLGALVDAQQRMADARKSLDEKVKRAKGDAVLLANDLGNVEDDRARQCHDALIARSWDLEKIETIVGGVAGGESTDTNLELLRRLTQLEPSPPDAVQDAVEHARAAATAIAALRGTDAERADRIAGILEQALEHHDHAGDGPCPVCGTGALDAAWRERAATELSDLVRQAEAVRAAATGAQRARGALRGIAPPIPDALVLADDAGIDASEARRSWVELSDLPDDLIVAADHVGRVYETVVRAVADVRDAAQHALDEREETWAPLAIRIAAWLDGAKHAAPAAAQVKSLKKGEDWLKKAADEIRNQRLAPLARQSAEIWNEMRQQSNVDLGPIRLTGTGPQRRVELNVSVDGVDSVALSVMSQGELYAMALALFLPRATSAESPFRFLIIDDPVQAMDPAKVDGLARVLHDVAQRRQVVVFTHDDRLPESVRRLQIPATVMQVTRRSNSVVEVATIGDPASRYIDDAMAIARTDDLPIEVRKQVVPGFARLAIEAMLSDVSRRRLLGDGVAHEEVERRLNACTTLNKLAALALFEDESRAGEVGSTLNKRYSREVADAYFAANKGAHEGFDGDLVKFVRGAEQLVNGLRKQA